MSITKETVQAHLKDPAIFCCRREKGLVISEKDLEDPGLFDDMVDSGLLELTDDALTIEQVLGRTLLVDADALVPLKAEMLDGVNEAEEEAAPEAEEAPAEEVPQEPVIEEEAPAPQAPVFTAPAPEVRATGGMGMIHIEIEND